MDTKRWYPPCTPRFDRKYSFPSRHKTGCTAPGVLTVSRLLFVCKTITMHNLDPSLSTKTLTSRFPYVSHKGGCETHECNAAGQQSQRTEDIYWSLRTIIRLCVMPQTHVIEFKKKAQITVLGHTIDY